MNKHASYSFILLQLTLVRCLENGILGNENNSLYWFDSRDGCVEKLLWAYIISLVTCLGGVIKWI